MPKSAGSIEQPVYLIRRVPFPRMKNLRQFKSQQRLHDTMYVIRHDAPCEQPIPRPIKILQSRSHNFSDSWILEPTISVTRVEVFVNTLGVKPVELRQIACGQFA
jgi:hypothetical protein